MSDVLNRTGEPNDEVRKQITTARAIVFQGLGDGPVRFCLSAKENHFQIWKRLKDRYAVSNTGGGGRGCGSVCAWGGTKV